MSSGPTARTPLLAWLALAVVYVVWGSTYLAIRVGVRDLPPAIFSGIRFLVAGALLYAISLRSAGPAPRRPARPQPREWLGCTVVGVLLLGVGNGGVSLAEQHLDSGLTALLLASIPLWMLALSAAVERRMPPLVHLVGIGCGLIGVAVIAVGGTTRAGVSSVAIALLAALGWSVGSVLAGRLPMPEQRPLATAMQMLAGGVVLIAVGAARGEFGAVRPSAASASAWGAFAYLVLAGSVLAFSAYGYALASLPLTTVSTYAYVNPVVAVLLGVTLVGERLTVREILGALIVVGAVGLAVQRPHPRNER